MGVLKHKPNDHNDQLQVRDKSEGANENSKLKQVN